MYKEYRFMFELVIVGTMLCSFYLLYIVYIYYAYVYR